MNDKEGVEKCPCSQRSRMVDVVVIDDDESMCEGCRQTLEDEGFRVAIARDGSLGLRLVEELRPNVVIVDIKMPGIDGLNVLAGIPEIDSTIVSIAISGFGIIDTASESKKAGAFDFLAKPFEPEQLVKTVKRGIKLSQFREEKEEGE